MELLGIELEPADFDRLICEQNAGKELKVIDGEVVAVACVLTQKETVSMQIAQLKQQIAKYKEDVEQVELFGMQRDDYEQKKELCKNIILQLRELEKQLKEDN